MELAGAIIFVLVLIFRGFRWVLRQTGTLPKPGPALPPPLPQVPPSLQTPANFQASPNFQAPARPTPLPVRAASMRLMPRQPEAGGPAVFAETSTRDFIRQEQELTASEPAAIRTPLTSAAPATVSQTGALFGGTDDLVRAVILQEVLGPPLSRRRSSSP